MLRKATEYCIQTLNLNAQLLCLLRHKSESQKLFSISAHLVAIKNNEQQTDSKQKMASKNSKKKSPFKL